MSDPVVQDESRAPLVGDGLAAVAVALAGVLAIVTFLPAQGFVATPLRSALQALLGRLAFAVPLLLLVAGVARLTQAAVPRRRLLGLGLLLIGVLLAEHVISPGEAGLAGQWLADSIVEALGGVALMAVLMSMLGLGFVLTFQVCRGQK